MYKNAVRLLGLSQEEGQTFDLSLYFLANWMQFVIGIPVGFLIFVIIYPLFDLLPIGGVSLWSIWDILGPTASIGRLFRVIDACYLDTEIIHRVIFLKYVFYAAAWFAGRCLWRAAITGRITINDALLPVERVLLAFLMCIGICAYSLQATINPSAATACVRWFNSIL